MASAYKWRITNEKYAYITTEAGGEPFIAVDGMASGVTIDDSAISVAANSLNEIAYANKYDTMCNLIREDEDGRNIDMLDYSYFFNMDNNSTCSTVNYGIQGVGIANIVQSKVNGINTITFILTNGASYAITINDGEKGDSGQDGLRGQVGAVGAAGSDGEAGTLDENLVRQIVNDMNVTQTVREAIMTDINGTLSDLDQGIETALSQIDDVKTNNGDITERLVEIESTANDALDKAREAFTKASAATEFARVAIASATTSHNEYDSLETKLLELQDTIIGIQDVIRTIQSYMGYSGGTYTAVADEYTRVAELLNIISERQILFSGFIEAINERLDLYDGRIDSVENIGVNAMESAVTISIILSGIQTNISIDEADVAHLLDFEQSAITRLNDAEANISTLSGSVETTIEASVTSGNVRDIISMMVDPDLSNLSNRIDVLNGKVQSLDYAYINLSGQTFGYLDPNVDQLILKVKTIATAVTTNTNNIENLDTRVTNLEGA